MKTIVEVIQEDIDNGVKLDCGKCPIARAFYRLGFKEVSIIHYVSAQANGKFYAGDLPIEADNFITYFDADNEVFPFTFEIEMMEV